MMTNTSCRLRSLASSLCQFEEADLMVTKMLRDARDETFWGLEAYMYSTSWTGPIAPWRKTVQEELESIYAEYQSTIS